MGKLLHFHRSQQRTASAASSALTPKPGKERGADEQAEAGLAASAQSGLRAPSVSRFLQERWKTVKTALRLNSPSLWIKSAQVVLLAVAVCFTVGATDNSGSRMNNLSHRLMCQCGCNQLLGECDHIGCPSRDPELAELSADIAAGMTDQQILNSFTAKYGDIVLAAPPAKGFDLVAWIAPFAVFLAALLGTILLIRRWGGLRGFKPQSPDASVIAGDFTTLEPAERERRERIRRETNGETGLDGGLPR